MTAISCAPLSLRATNVRTVEMISPPRLLVSSAYTFPRRNFNNYFVQLGEHSDDNDQ